jgi:hypothetical protein
MSVIWLFGEIVAGVLLAGGVTGVVTVAAGPTGLNAGVWLPGVILAVCVGASIATGEVVRRRSRP